MIPKFDAYELKPELISIVLSALIYDEDNFSDRVMYLFGFEVHCWKGKIGKHFYAVVTDALRDRVWIVCRGTDGDNAWGRILSWFNYNLRFAITPEGFHTGFWRLASKVSKDTSKYISKHSHLTVYLAGHSQGAGVVVCLFAMICRVLFKAKLLKNIIFLQADLFGAPPAVSDKGKYEIDGYLKNSSVKLNDWLQGDILQQKKGILHGLLKGRRVGNQFEMPNQFNNEYGVVDKLVSHSPFLLLRAYQDMPGMHQLDKDVITYVLDKGWVIN